MAITHVEIVLKFPIFRREEREIHNTYGSGGIPNQTNNVYGRNISNAGHRGNGTCRNTGLNENLGNYGNSVQRREFCNSDAPVSRLRQISSWSDQKSIG